MRLSFISYRKESFVLFFQNNEFSQDFYKFKCRSQIIKRVVDGKLNIEFDGPNQEVHMLQNFAVMIHELIHVGHSL